MRRLLSILTLGLALAACGDGEPRPLPFCEGQTRLIYDPPSGDYNTYPDDYFTVEDPATRTGLRVAMVPGVDIVVEDNVADYANSFYDLSTLDGYGTTGAIVLRFTGPLDELSLPAGGDGSGHAGASLVLVNLDADPPAFVDVEVTTVEEDDNDLSTTLVISPVGPLLPKTRYGVAVTNRVLDGDGSCIAPSETMKELLGATATDPRLRRLDGRISMLVEALVTAGTVVGPEELTAAVVFTTQSTWETSAEVAAQIRASSFTYRSLGACVDFSEFRECEGEFDADDFRVDGRAVDDANPAPQRRYTIPITTWLPTTGTPPYPTLIFGHGLGGDRHQARRLAEFAAPLGVATIAIDSVKHGDHPDQADATTDLIRMLEFFGISVTFDPPLDGLALRDNFRQSTYDKLALLELLRPGVDIDGDTTPDVSHDQLGFLGVSLGGLMSSEFLAFAPEAEVAIVVVPGANVGGIIQHGPLFGMLVEFMRGSATDGQVARFFPMLQGVIDRGDPGAYTRHIVRERLPGFDDATPQVLMQMVLDDEIVPNVSNLAYAQGLGAPLVGDELLHIPGVSHEQTLPVSENIGSGVTAGVYQFDVVPSDDGSTLETATHDNVATSTVGIEQSLHFLTSYQDTGIAEIIDSYRTLGIKQ
ncbi:MAG: hypothetical protein ABI333_01830 [bacterium]